MNARYVIATSAKVGLDGIDEKTLEKVGEEGYFTREKKKAKSDEDSFFKQGEKPEASPPSFQEVAFGGVYPLIPFIVEEENYKRSRKRSKGH